MHELSHQVIPTICRTTSYPKPLDRFGSPVSPVTGDSPQVDWVSTHSTSHSACSGQSSRDTPASIRAEYAPKFKRLQLAAQSAIHSDKPELAISMFIDMVCEENSMLLSMSWATGSSMEELEDQRFIRRNDIDSLITCAHLVGDCEAKLLGETLSKNLQNFRKNSLICEYQAVLPGF
jgi:hypothetical protein